MKHQHQETTTMPMRGVVNGLLIVLPIYAVIAAIVRGVINS